MKRNKKAEKLKAFYRKREELWENEVAQANLGYKLLDKPIHKGYDGEWTLRADISRRADAEDFEGLIHYYGVSVWCKDDSFTRWDRKEKREVEIKPYFKKISEKEYETLRPWIKRFFTYSFGDDVVRWGGEVYRYYRVNVPEYYFKLKTSKHYKTHYKVIDEILLQEEDEIRKNLRSNYYEIQIKEWERHHSRRWDKQISHRMDRTYNKATLKKKLKFMGTGIEDDFQFRYGDKDSYLDWWW